jgi:hypothetical protein
MKVTLTIELELPDDTPVIEGHEFVGLNQLVFDRFVNYAACSHLSDSFSWYSKHLANPNDANAKGIYEYHKQWSGICSNATWSMTVNRDFKKD